MAVSVCLSVNCLSMSRGPTGTVVTINTFTNSKGGDDMNRPMWMFEKNYVTQNNNRVTIVSSTVHVFYNNVPSHVIYVNKISTYGSNTL